MKQEHPHIPIGHIDNISLQGIKLFHGKLGQEICWQGTSYKNHPHRHEYYMFFFIETARNLRFTIDFKDFEIGNAENILLYIRPEQVHFITSLADMECWFLNIASVLVSEAYRKVFDEPFPPHPIVHLDDHSVQPLKQMCGLLHLQIQASSPFAQQITTSMAQALIGRIAEQFLSRKTTDMSSLQPRFLQIAGQFQKALAVHFRQVKSPMQYARMLNYSLSYLNEAVKAATGLPVSHWIQKKIILEAKRELYYTDKDVKEIAFSLGYEDPAYFSRLFVKACGEPPLSFRRKYRG